MNSASLLSLGCSLLLPFSGPVGQVSYEPGQLAAASDAGSTPLSSGLLVPSRTLVPSTLTLQSDPDTGGVSAENAARWSLDRITYQVNDPTTARPIAEQLLQESESAADRRTTQQFIDRLGEIDRPDKRPLTLEEALRLALANNFAIRVTSYNPAIETTRIVEAEAAFDASFFANLSNNKVDRPAANALQGTELEEFNAQAGIRKLMANGMQVETSYSTQRSSNNFQFQAINPVWFDQFVVQFRQPLLRGFGIDFNRSQIRLGKLGRRQAWQQFRRQIRDILRQTEEAYWRLVQARRSLVINARLLADFEQIYNYLDARKDFDVYRIQLADTRARLESSKADFIQLIANVRNAEDQLIALMNDPNLDLADDIEIIPLDSPPVSDILLDRIAEVQTALENRSELIEAKVSIDSARVQIGVAKNQAMPQLDLTFRYAVDGLGESQHDAFSEVTKNDFHEYFIAIEFELPVGNRARRSALKRAKLQHAQAIANLKATFEQVVLEVNTTVRNVGANHDQIEPNLLAVEATEDRVRSIQERAEKKDFLTLNNELNAKQTLAQAREVLLNSLVEYAISIVDLERSKGTLLQYNNVNLSVDEPGDPTG